MTDDNTSKIAGDYPGGLRLTCILDEGAPTIVTSFDQMGLEATSYTFATPLEEGDVVALSNDSANTYVACGGIPVVEKPANGETLVFGRIVSTPQLQAMPAADADADTLAERLSGEYYRIADVEIWAGITKITKATVMANGTNATVPGVGATLKFNITSGYSATDQGLQFDSAASAGVGVIPFHAVPAGTDGDLYSCLVGITGPMIAITGA